MSDLQTQRPQAPVPEPDRPIALTPNFSGMPLELTPLVVWVVWRYEWDGKKRWRKVPYTPIAYNPEQRRKARTNDLATARSYADAKKVYLAAPHIFDGVGVIIDGDLVGGDFDHCYDPTTEDMSDFARANLPSTYAEYSPSHTGYRFLAYGTIARPHKTARAELYDRNSPRFLTLTGRRVPGQPATIAHCQDAITHLEAVISGEPSTPRTPRSGTPRLSTRDKSRKQLAADIPESIRNEARQIYRTQAVSLERRFKAAAWKEETQWWCVARRDYAGFHARYPFVGLYDADGTFDPSQARMATGRAIRGLGFTLPEYAALMTLYFANDRADMLARWGNKDVWWEELADVWQKSAPAKRGIWQPKQAVAKRHKPVGRASDHAAQVERVYVLIKEQQIGDKAIIKTADLAAEAGMHRVTLSNILTELRGDTEKGLPARIHTERLGRYGGLTVTFSDVAIVVEQAADLSIATPQTEQPSVAPLEETHTHTVFFLESGEPGYSLLQPVPTLADLAAAYLNLPAPRVENISFDRETGEIKVKSQTDKPLYRRTAKHFAAWITAAYGEHYTSEQADAAYKAERQRREELKRQEWQRLFARFKAMPADELIAFICSGRLAEVTEFSCNGIVRDAHYYRTRMDCAKRSLAWRGLKMPERLTKQKPVTPRKRQPQPVVTVEQVDLFSQEPSSGTPASLLAFLYARQATAHG